MLLDNILYTPNLHPHCLPYLYICTMHTTNLLYTNITVNIVMLSVCVHAGYGFCYTVTLDCLFVVKLHHHVAMVMTPIQHVVYVDCLFSVLHTTISHYKDVFGPQLLLGPMYIRGVVLSAHVHMSQCHRMYCAREIYQYIHSFLYNNKHL